MIFSFCYLFPFQLLALVTSLPPASLKPAVSPHSLEELWEEEKRIESQGHRTDYFGVEKRMGRLTQTNGINLTSGMYTDE